MKSVLIGYGYWGKIIKKYIENNNFFELVGIYDPSFEESMKKEDILNDKTIRCAFVCNPIDFHYSSVKELLESGKHVFCEKPLCKNLKDTEELLNLAKKGNLCLYTDYIYTNSPSINLIKENIELLGKVLYCDGDIKQFGKFYENDDVFEVLSVHIISAISYIFDAELEVEKVICKKRDITGMVLSGALDFKIKDKIKGRINNSLIDSKKERKLVFICEKGNIIFDMLGETTVTITKHIKKENEYVEEIVLNERYDESNNLILALNQFKEYINRKTSNEQITLNVVKVLEDIRKLNYER